MRLAPVCGAFFLAASAGVAQESAELAAMRGKYEAAKIEAIKPLMRSYGLALRAKVSELTQAGKLEEALAFKKEMDAVAAELTAIAAAEAEGVAAPVPGRKKIDLLGMVDLAADGSPASKWLMEDGKLRCRSGFAIPKVLLPYEPAAEYDVSVTFIQPRAQNGVALLIPNGAGSNFMVHAGGGSGSRAGLGVKGKEGDEWVKKKDGWFDGKNENTLTVEVRKGSVEGKVDGESIFKFEGERSSLIFGGRGFYRNPKPTRLGVTGDDGSIITKLEVTEVDGSGKLLREK